MLKQCREKDQQKKAVSEIDDVSRLPLSKVMTKENHVTLFHWCDYELMKNRSESFLCRHLSTGKLRRTEEPCSKDRKPALRDHRFL